MGKVSSHTRDVETYDLIKKMGVSTSWGIQTYSEFLSQTGNNWKTKELKSKIEVFKKNLERENPNLWEIDPIWYLRRLYFEKQLSLKRILEKVGDKWLDYTDFRWLHYLFREVLWWKLRDASELTPLQIKGIENIRNHPNKKKNNKKALEGGLTTLNNALIKVLEEKKEKDKIEFSMEVFESFVGKKSEKHNKICYLLECYAGFSFEDILLAGENSWRWARTITRMINTKIDVIKIQKRIDEDLEILVQSVSYHLAQRKKKRNSN